MNRIGHMMNGVTSNEARVTSSGQISLPAQLRRRWGTSSVLVIDRGDYAIVRPMPQDPIGELRGAHAGDGPSTDEARAAERETDLPRPRHA
jgi:bifunctional DNA-binding transcriptional regulator/antitoxin component of YhaV-PrlF toxin-antitoxin module